MPEMTVPPAPAPPAGDAAGELRDSRRPARPDHGAAEIDGRFLVDLVWNIQNGVVAVDRESRLVTMNATAYRVLGLEQSPAHLGRPARSVLVNHPELAAVLESAFELAELPDRAELRIGPLGQVLGYTLSHVRDRHGEVIGAALLFRDLTLVEQQEERERLRDRLAALGEMAAAIAHEVKNPLAGIEVMAGVLRRRLADRSDAQAALAEIIHEVKAANQIVVKVLEFVRPVSLQPEPVAVAGMLREAVASAERETARGNVLVEIDAPRDLPDLYGDTQLLHQLFTNLVRNAFEALGGRGAVSVSARYAAAAERASARMQVDVMDDGPGIPPETLDHVFSPFFTTKAKGSGLGLAMVRKTAEAHGGRIEVTTPPGGGTRFRVLLPLHPRSQQPAETRVAGETTRAPEARDDSSREA